MTQGTELKTAYYWSEDPERKTKQCSPLPLPCLHQGLSAWGPKTNARRPSCESAWVFWEFSDIFEMCVFFVLCNWIRYFFQQIFILVNQIYIYIQILLWAILFSILRINYDVHLSGPRPRFTLQWSSNLNIVFNMACCQWLLIIGGNDQYDRKENYAIIECINYCTPCIYICKVCHNWYGQYDLYAKYAMMNTHDQYDRYAKYAKYAVVQNENEWESSGSPPAK